MALMSPVVIQANNRPNTPLGSAMNEIRTWLDGKKIETVHFKTVVGSAGLGFEISFKSEQDAERFQQRFPALVAS
jgi:hypothetical protein